MNLAWLKIKLQMQAPPAVLLRHPAPRILLLRLRCVKVETNTLP
jgi:hypothetical protein